MDINQLDELFAHAETAINDAIDLKSLENLRVHLLGKKSELSAQLKSLGKLTPAERPLFGQKINVIKQSIEALLENKRVLLTAAAVEEKLQRETQDVTLPGRMRGVGSIHPITHTFNELREIFTRLGFIFRSGPEIEEERFNFDDLNIPPSHPARAMMDTFYFADKRLLRTHMSPVQIRTLLNVSAPIRMVAMGRVYRRDFDITHTPMFHQMECLVIEPNATFAQLKGLLNYFLERFFQTSIKTRFRPSYFPFTEPSAEVDISCLKCDGKGCRICKHTGWLEVLGCGMVHPNVLAAVNMDASSYQGFAFGVGVDRLTLLKYNIPDLRSLFENDLRFLKQFLG